MPKVTDPNLVARLNAAAAGQAQQQVPQAGAPAGGTLVSTTGPDPRLPAQITKGNIDAQTAGATAPYAGPQAQADLEGKRLTNQKLQLEADAAAREQQGKGDKANTIRGFSGALRQLYEQDLKGQPLTRAFGATEYIPALPANSRFNAAGNIILPLVRPLIAQSAREGDSDKEMAIFQSYIPQAGDPDPTIEYKLNALEALLGGVVDGKTPSEIEAALISGGVVPLPVTITDESDDGPPNATPPSGETGLFGEGGRRFHMGVGDVAEGVGDVLGLIANPVNAGINAVFGTNLGTDLGSAFRKFIGAPEPQTDEERLASAINSGGTAALSGAGAARAALPLLTGGARAAATALAEAPAVDTAAGVTSGASGEYARQEGFGTTGQIIASLFGGGVGAIGASKVAARAARPRTVPQNELTRAGSAEGVPVNRAMVDPSLQNKVTGVEATMAGGPVIQREMGNVGSAIERGVQRLGQGGTALDDSVAGNTVANMSRRYIDASGKRARNIYGVAEKAAGDTKVTPKESLKAVDDVIARLSETPEINASEIAFLNKMRSDFQGDLSVGALRRLRTSLRKKISKGELTYGEDEAAVLGVMDAAADDIAAGLAKAGKGKAADLFKQADAFYRDRQSFINGTIQKLIGKRNSNLTDGQIFANFRNMATPKGDLEGMARLMKTAEPEEVADIAATFAQALGRNNKGDFSTAHLVSQAQKLPQAARVNVFGPEGAESLGNLITLAKAHDRVMSGLNKSRTGVANNWRGVLQNAALSGPAGLGVGMATGSATAGASTFALGLSANLAKAFRDNLSAKMLMNKDVSKWLLIAPATRDPKQIDKHLNRLKIIAARNPALSSDIQAFQQSIMRAANENVPLSSAASESEGQNENR